MVGLYDFCKNFEVIETTTQIKGEFYKNAIKYMQTELDRDEREKQTKEEAKQEALQDAVDQMEWYLWSIYGHVIKRWSKMLANQ